MHRSHAYLPTLLALVLALACAQPAFALSAADARAHQRAADAARAKAAQQQKLADELLAETKKLDDIVDDLQAEADALDPQISAATKRSNRLRAEVAAFRAKIKLKQMEIDQTQARYDEEQGYFEGRVTASYKQGDFFFVNMLLSAEDLGDLVTRTEFIARTIKSSNDIAAGLVETRDSLERAKVELDRSLETAAAKKREAVAAENKIRDLQDARQAKTDRQDAVLDKKSALMADTKKNAKRLRALAEAEEAESDRIASELAGGGSGRFAGTMAWPVPSSHRITSNYGPRICPFHGRELHPGIDIGAPSGSPIVSAGAGTVTYAGWRGSYGNFVMVNHGNGVVTCYAHQTSGGIKVHVGQRVSKGQRIGTVGSTGNSTGPHLHFEVRVNGTPKNPMTYR
ncbi:MAG: peptidoglycan DD-metalloendopeptidase family protein [Coriobacteriia bacterium]|nr:peptidoglycan DD-metalloendopeptidase family protein [Coriobacteriia bacterium]